MIIKDGDNISFDSKEDYQFLIAFQNLINKYCKENDELGRKIMTNFFKSFVQEN